MEAGLDSVVSSAIDCDSPIAAAAAAAAGPIHGAKRQRRALTGDDSSGVGGCPNISDYTTLTCSHDDCGVTLSSVGWICDCRHAFCELHMPQRTEAGQHDCPVCHKSLSPEQIHHFDSAAVRATGKFALVGASYAQAFAALDFLVELWMQQCGADMQARVQRLETRGPSEQALKDAEAERAQLTTLLSGMRETVGKLRGVNVRCSETLRQAGLELHKQMTSASQYRKAERTAERRLAETRAKEADAARQLETRRRENRRLRQQLHGGSDHRRRLGRPDGDDSGVGDGGDLAGVNVGEGSGCLGSGLTFDSATLSSFSGGGGGGSGIGDGESTIGPSASAVGAPAGSDLDSALDDGN